MSNKTVNIFKITCLFILIWSLISCDKDDLMYPEEEQFIKITDEIIIDNGVKINDPVFNYQYYDNFLKHISSSDHFIIVPMKDFKNTNSEDKVIISLRYDIDFNINSAVKFAYREHKYGIKSTYFILHTADYYGTKEGQTFIRNKDVIHYIKKIQNDFGHEIGFHNDLVTLQLMYGIAPVRYLKEELEWLRSNEIRITGTTYHGSQYCYIYNYSNTYFWKDYPHSGPVNEIFKKGFKTIKIERDRMSNNGFDYEGNLLEPDYFFADAYYVNGMRWNMSMVNLDTIKPGKKVIILLHPGNWN